MIYLVLKLVLYPIRLIVIWAMLNNNKRFNSVEFLSHNVSKANSPNNHSIFSYRFMHMLWFPNSTIIFHLSFVLVNWFWGNLWKTKSVYVISLNGLWTPKKLNMSNKCHKDSSKHSCDIYGSLGIGRTVKTLDECQ